MIRASIIIPHYNQPEQLARCLNALVQQSACKDCEIIVVDNGSVSPPLPADVERFGARLLSEAEPGPGPARNTGARASSGQFLLFVDADCRADSGWISSAIEALDAQPGPIGGDVRIDFVNPAAATALEAYEAVFSFRQQLYIEHHGFSGTGNLAMPRATYDQVGPFAGMGVSEDADWGRRAARAGLPTRYVAGMIVYHPSRRVFGELETKWRRHLDHSFEEAGPGALAKTKWFIRESLAFASTLPHMLKIAASTRVRGARAKLGGIGVLLRIRWFRFTQAVITLVAGRHKTTSDWQR